MHMMMQILCEKFRAQNAHLSQHYQGRSDGGYIGIYTPPPKKKNQSTLIFCGCFVSLQWLVNIYTHPNQIPGYATGHYHKYCTD